MNKGYDKIMDLAKGFLITDEKPVKSGNSIINTISKAAEGTDSTSKDKGGLSDLLGMATNLLGDSSSDEDNGFLDIAQNALGALGDSIDPMTALKDGKIDVNDLLELGKIFSKIKK